MMLRKRLTRTPVSFTATIAYRSRTKSGIRSDRSGVGEAVSDARHGQDVIRTGGLRLDLPAQIADVHVDDPCLDRVLVAPDGVEDLLPAAPCRRCWRGDR